MERPVNVNDAYQQGAFERYLSALNASGTGQALPLESYRSTQAFDLEQSQVFHRDWVFVGTTSGLDSPGDLKPVRVGQQPVLLWRGGDGELRALANICAHRGMLLAEVPANHERLVCPYHAWSYDDGGKLLGAPFGKEIDRKSHCLQQYQVTVWCGLVFVCLDKEAGGFEHRASAVDDALKGFMPSEASPWPGYDTEQEWDANWKLIYANAVESYHLFQVHPQTLEPYTPTRGARTLDSVGDVVVSAGELRDGSKGPSKGEYRLIGFPPNLVCVLDGSGLYWQTVEPVSPSRSVVRTGAVLPGRQPASSVGRFVARTLGAMWFGMADDFLPEDKAICERAQRATTGTFTPGKLVELEEPVAHFHRYLAQRLSNDRSTAS